MRLIRLSLIALIMAVSVVAVAQEPIPISDLHANDGMGLPLLIDQIVTIQGVVTVPSGVFNSSRTDVYIQDDTGGMNLFSFNPVATYNEGDEVKVTGTVLAYRGLTEVEPITVELIATGQPLPEPLVLTCAELRDSYDFATNTEPNEARLVRLNGVTWDSGNYALMDSTGTAMMYITPATGIPYPEGEFNVVGVVKQYDDAGEEGPWYLGYEVLPRYLTDITYGSGPQFVTLPVQTGVAMGGATISWTTDTECETILEYGTTTDFELGQIRLGNSTTDHEAVLTGLPSAAVYFVRAVATDGTDSINSPPITIVSPSEHSTGKMDVYFSKSVDTAYSTGVDAVQTNIADRMVEMINAATTSIDFCFANFTHDDVADALVNAHNRGVAVQVIYEVFDPVINVLTVAGIEVKTDPDEEHENTHNKFAIFDARDADETNDRVWTGSWNATYNGTNENAENAIVVHDAALATAYTIEFDEMWGGTFSNYKVDNTPHMFLIGDRFVEQYMGPTDGLRVATTNLIRTGDSDILFAIYGFTEATITNALAERFNAGVAVRGVFDAGGADYDYSQYPPMVDLGADVVIDNVEQGGDDQLMHHKYLMTDPLSDDSDPTVVTGSYNWTFTAETYKDENILIIHDATITNIFFQEWMARYHEAGGEWDVEMPGSPSTIYIAAAASFPDNDPPWASDLGINNTGTEDLTYKFKFLPRGEDNTNVAYTEEMTLAANTSASFVDVWNTYAGQGAGSIAVYVSDPDVASVVSRIYTTTDEGTLGQSFVGMAGVNPAKLIGTEDVARLGFLTENADFRTNVGFMNAGATAITVMAEFFTADGTSLGTSNIDLPPYSSNQWNRAFRQVTTDAVDLGFIDVWSDSVDAQFLAYGSVIDNNSDDPTTIWPFDTTQMVGGEGFDCTPVYVAAAASFPFNNPAWASDLGVTNLGSDTLTYKFQFLVRGNDNSSAVMSDPFTLGGNQAIAYTDIWSMTGGSGAGAINVCVDNADNAGIVSRIYSIGDNGTFGQGFVGVRGSAPAKVATGEKVRLAYLFQNETYRTNIGFMNAGANAITVTAEFFDKDGNSLGTKSIDLLAYSNYQWNNAFTLDPINAGDIEAGFVDVWSNTADANFLTYASIVDNGTGDPTTIWPF